MDIQDSILINLYNVFELDTEDKHVRYVIADRWEELGRQAYADATRWMIENSKKPLYMDYSKTLEWYVWYSPNLPVSYKLPEKLITSMDNEFSKYGHVIKQYKTVLKAELAVLDGWKKINGQF